MCNLVCTGYLTQDIWRQWLDRGMSGTNEMLLLETCLCVYVCICVCVFVPPSHPSNSLNFQQCIRPSRSDMRWHSLFIHSQGHALHVSLCRCHQSSQHWRRDGNSNNSGSVFVCQDSSGSSGEGIAGFMKHDSCLDTRDSAFDSTTKELDT